MFGALSAFAFVAVLWGLYLMIFRKGKRAIGLSALIAGVLTFAGAGHLVSNPTPIGPAVAAVAEVAAPASVAAPPSEMRPKFDSSAGLASYCEAMEKIVAARTEADDQFGSEYSDKRDAWLRTENDQIAGELSEALSVPYDVWLTYASENGWEYRCDALARNWVAVSVQDLGKSSSADGVQVMQAIEIEYEARLRERSKSDPLFDPARFNGTHCDTDVVEGFRFAGCVIIGDDWASEPLVYLVANLNGEPVIVPFDNSAMEHMRKPRYPNADGKALQVGRFVGPYPLPNVEYGRVEDFFEK